MRKAGSGRRLLAEAIGIGIMAVIVKAAALNVQAAEMLEITSLAVAASEDGTGVIAKCSYQNYTDQSGCEVRLYLYKIEDGAESVESQKTLAYAERGSDSTQPRQVEEGVYRASVTIDNGTEIRQVNSSNYYRVSQIEGNYVVTEEADRNELIQEELENENQKETGSSCSHVCEYILIEEATPVKDALQAYQCIRCGVVLEYADVPNSAYAAFLSEVVNLIQNTQQEEVIISTDRWMSFNRDVFEAMKIRPEMSVKVNYRYLGGEYLLVIPAGIEVECLMDENGYGGFRYIEEILNIEAGS